MGKVTSTKLSRAKKTLYALRAVVSTLPSRDEKEESMVALESIIQYLLDAKKQIGLIPEREEMDGLLNAIEKLDALLMRAEENPVVGRALGLEKARIKRPASAHQSINLEHAKAILRELESLTIDQVRSALQDPRRFSMGALRSTATSLRMRFSDRIGREALANQIATYLANARGYRQLSGETSDISIEKKEAKMENGSKDQK